MPSRWLRSTPVRLRQEGLGGLGDRISGLFRRRWRGSQKGCYPAQLFDDSQAPISQASRDRVAATIHTLRPVGRRRFLICAQLPSCSKTANHRRCRASRHAASGPSSTSMRKALLLLASRSCARQSNMNCVAARRRWCPKPAGCSRCPEATTAAAPLSLPIPCLSWAPPSRFLLA